LPDTPINFLGNPQEVAFPLKIKKKPWEAELMKALELVCQKSPSLPSFQKVIKHPEPIKIPPK